MRGLRSPHLQIAGACGVELFDTLFSNLKKGNLIWKNFIQNVRKYTAQCQMIIFSNDRKIFHLMSKVILTHFGKYCSPLANIKK